METPRRTREDPEWQMLISEYQALKRKLHSKSEALLILSKDLGSAHKEREHYKQVIEKFRGRCQAYKRQIAEYRVSGDQATLLQMLRDARNQKLAHQKQGEILQQKLNEALGDVKLLRERFARERIGDEGVGLRHFQAHKKNELVEQLEKSIEETSWWKQKYNGVMDEISDLRLDCSEYKSKAERLNTELSYVLSGDKKRIIDVDALCMENKYLQERVKQCQEEKNALHVQINKYKSILNSRRNTREDLLKQKNVKSGSGLIFSPKQIKEILQHPLGSTPTKHSVSDLQSIASALLETINDKNLAMHHLRNTNKILGNRVSELEGKLKALEVSGLWNVQELELNLKSECTDEKCDTHSIVTKNDYGLQTKTSIDNDEFISNLGSRLSKLTDIRKSSTDEYKLVSLTPDSSVSGEEICASPQSDQVHSNSENMLQSNCHENDLPNNSTTTESFNNASNGHDSEQENCNKTEIGATSSNMSKEASINDTGHTHKKSETSDLLNHEADNVSNENSAGENVHD